MSSFRIVARWLDERTTPIIGNVVGSIAAVTFIGMVVAVMIDVTGRRFNLAILGTYEIVSYLLVITFFLSMCYTGTKKFHHAIDMLSTRFPRHTRLLILTVLYLVSAIMCWIMCVKTIEYAQAEKASGVHGYMLTSVPVYPFIFIAAIGLAIQGWLFLVQFLNYLSDTTCKEG